MRNTLGKMKMLRMLLVFLGCSLFAEDVTETFRYEYLNKFLFHGNGKIEIVQGSENVLELSADRRLLRNTEVSVNQGELIIHPVDLDLAERYPEILHAKLTVKELDKIFLAGNAQVDIDEMKGDHLMIVMQLGGASLLEGTIDYDYLIVNLYGSAEASLRGKVKDQTVYIKGSGKYSGEHLKSVDTTVNIEGSGTAYVWPTGNLDASIMGFGHIHYVKKPKAINTRVEGTGKVSPYTKDMGQ